jgi:DNA polymerase
MPKKLHLDIETYSSVDLKACGVYNYVSSIDFEILLIAYAFDNEPVTVIDLVSCEAIPTKVEKALLNPNIVKCAHNAAFERVAFRAVGFDVPPEQWECSMIKAAYCGLPLGLGKVSEALKLNEKGKMAEGTKLVNYFCLPCKPTKANEKRQRNFPWHDVEKWGVFKQYCASDVEAEREILQRLKAFILPDFEKQNYAIDQHINDRGVLVDLDFARKAHCFSEKSAFDLKHRIKEITGIDNPNSAPQLKQWLSSEMGKAVTTLAKETLPKLLENAESAAVKEVLECRSKLAKSSLKKYETMLNAVSQDGRARGLFQFYGASRTGRWAGRRIQLQNLPRNYMQGLGLAREAVLSGDYDLAEMCYDNIPNMLSELIRTSFIPKDNHLLAVADFSSIEARVLAWLAGEKWKIDVFKTHGKIYEAAASMMFGVPIENITKGSKLRERGKVAELALGYEGSMGALKQMGADRQGLSELEMSEIVRKWRSACPATVKFWSEANNRATQAIRLKKPLTYRHIGFNYRDNALMITLPSGRELIYYDARIATNRFGRQGISFQNNAGEKPEETYGGKLVENIVQATARDIMALALKRIHHAGFEITMHVHDEAVCEVPIASSEKDLKRMCALMGEPIDWAQGLPLSAEGFLTKYYKKD